MYAGWEHLLRTSLLHCCYLSQLQVRAKKKAFSLVRGNLAIVWTLEKAARKGTSQFLWTVVFQLFGECQMAGCAPWSCGWRRRWQGSFPAAVLLSGGVWGQEGGQELGAPGALTQLSPPHTHAPVGWQAPGSPHQSCTMAWSPNYLSATLFEAGIIFLRKTEWIQKYKQNGNSYKYANLCI